MEIRDGIVVAMVCFVMGLNIGALLIELKYIKKRGIKNGSNSIKQRRI